MKVALGSISESKLKYVKNFFHEKGLALELVPTKVASGISDQPLSEEETVTGAINRAINAFESGVAIAIGLEGGLHAIKSRYYLVCAAAIHTGEGNTYIGVSGKLPLPLKVSEVVKKGAKFGKAIRKYEFENESAELHGLIDELISREMSFAQAIENAFLGYFLER